MSHFLFKFTPRPDFVETMTEAEAAVMAEHAAYWRSLVAKRVALVVGPVGDPAGAWGMAVIEAESPEAAEAIVAADPAAINRLGPVAVFPMLSVILPD